MPAPRLASSAAARAAALTLASSGTSSATTKSVAVAPMVIRRVSPSRLKLPPPGTSMVMRPGVAAAPGTMGSTTRARTPGVWPKTGEPPASTGCVRMTIRSPSTATWLFGASRLVRVARSWSRLTVAGVGTAGPAMAMEVTTPPMVKLSVSPVRFTVPAAGALMAIRPGAMPSRTTRKALPASWVVRKVPISPLLKAATPSTNGSPAPRKTTLAVRGSGPGPPVQVRSSATPSWTV